MERVRDGPFAEDVADTSHPDWDSAAKAIANSDEYPEFKGKPFSQQEGLTALGKDPVSLLFEFAVDGTGSVPSRDPETGRLVVSGSSAVILVLIPGGTFRMGSPPEDKQGNPDER